LPSRQIKLKGLCKRLCVDCAAKFCLSEYEMRLEWERERDENGWMDGYVGVSWSDNSFSRLVSSTSGDDDGSEGRLVHPSSAAARSASSFRVLNFKNATSGCNMESWIVKKYHSEVGSPSAWLSCNRSRNVTSFSRVGDRTKSPRLA
jgi:hypothetical protein